MKNNKLKKFLINLYEKCYVWKMKYDDYCQKRRLGVPHIMTIDETLDYLYINKCSVSRYGDGELKIACGSDIRFQKYDKKLSQRICEILKSSSENCLICLTDIFDDITWMMPKGYEYTWRIMSEYRREWTQLLDKNKLYGNAYITRCYIDRRDKSKSEIWFKKLKRLWENEEVVFVEGEKSRLGYHNDLFSNAASIQRILCPTQNAFSCYEEILNEVKKLDNNKLILLALGPTASVLAFDLSEIGYRALDIGHVDIEYEWFLRKETEKVKIEGKYTSEAPGGEEVGEVVDLEYKSQIICRIDCKAEE